MYTATAAGCFTEHTKACKTGLHRLILRAFARSYFVYKSFNVFLFPHHDLSISLPYTITIRYRTQELLNKATTVYCFHK